MNTSIAEQPTAGKLDPVAFPEFDPAQVRQRINAALAHEIKARVEQVAATVALLDDGATVPFIARYRKEATGGLDDTQLRLLDDRLRYRRELEERRAAVVRSILDQGKLSDALKADLLAADTLARVEDLYLPFKQKRRTRAMAAREAGLEPLALLLLNEPHRDPETEALAFVVPRPPEEVVQPPAAQIAESPTADSPTADSPTAETVAPAGMASAAETTSPSDATPAVEVSAPPDATLVADAGMPTEAVAPTEAVTSTEVVTVTEAASPAEVLPIAETVPAAEPPAGAPDAAQASGGAKPVVRVKPAAKAKAPAAAAAVPAPPTFYDVKSVLNGARDILVEKFGEDANLVSALRELLHKQGFVISTVIEGKQAAGAKFSDYFKHTERYANIPSHRALAMFRGRSENVLRLELSIDETPPENAQRAPFNACETRIAEHNRIADQGRPADKLLLDVVRWCWRTRMAMQLQIDLFSTLREHAETEAIRIFGANLKDLLLAAPAGPKVTLGLDPGLRTGVKVAVVDATGKLLATDTIFPHAPRKDIDGSIATLAALCETHKVTLIAIGNGTASRETEQLARELVKRHPQLALTPVVVSEAGASVYSASALAAREFPELDVSLRGAVSIARRLQDPLAELVKIDPKSIGVGQYQHDVNGAHLGRALDAVVEDCVNAVGVDLNTASAPLLARVSGLSSTVAQAIVQYRDGHGAFASREQLKQVPRLGERSFEQCAGFLRIMNGENPLDASAVHPESYPLVQRMLERIQSDAAAVIGNREALAQLNPADFVDERFGLPTVTDILKELEKPGRDPRPEFRTAKFTEGVNDLADLKPGMVLEGVITNVTAFGAFIDIGIHHEGLAHVSELADRFVKDPRDVVKAGQIVKARVLEVDAARKRIALTLKSAPGERQAQQPRNRPPGAEGRPRHRGPGGPGGPGGSGGQGRQERQAPRPAQGGSQDGMQAVPSSGAEANANTAAGVGAQALAGGGDTGARQDRQRPSPEQGRRPPRDPARGDERGRGPRPFGQDAGGRGQPRHPAPAGDGRRPPRDDRGDRGGRGDRGDRGDQARRSTGAFVNNALADALARARSNSGKR